MQTGVHELGHQESAQLRSRDMSFEHSGLRLALRSSPICRLTMELNDLTLGRQFSTYGSLVDTVTRSPSDKSSSVLYFRQLPFLCCHSLQGVEGFVLLVCMATRICCHALLYGKDYIGTPHFGFLALATRALLQAFKPASS